MTNTQQPKQSELIAALEAGYDALAKDHDLPPVAITVGSGARRNGLALGVFYPRSWVDTDGSETIHQINIGAEHLANDPCEVFATLAHEAAHAFNELHEIKDTSRQGRYHNKRFKKTAEEFGLTITHDDSIGWSLTKIPEATIERYRPQIDQIAAAITHYRKPAEPATKKPTVPAAQCDCPEPKKIRVAPSTIEAAPIICSDCMSPFVLDPVEHAAGEYSDYPNWKGIEIL